MTAIAGGLAALGWEEMPESCDRDDIAAAKDATLTSLSLDAPARTSVPKIASPSCSPEVPDHPAKRASRFEWMPHSVLARPRQRPARGSSPGLTRSVQVMHPIDIYPSATSGCRGRLRAAKTASISARDQPASGLTLIRPASSTSNSGSATRAAP